MGMNKKNKILVVDDTELNRDFLQMILENDFEIELAEDGVQALEKLKADDSEITGLLLDLQMPNMDGFAVLDVMKNEGWIEKIPVLVITGDYTIGVENRCFDMGITDFIRKPFEPSLVKNRVKNAVNLFLYKNNLEEKVASQTEELKQQYKLLEEQTRKLKETNEKIIDILGTVVEGRNMESGEHIRRVKGFTKILACELMRQYPEYGLTEQSIDIIVSASSLHDLGKISIPDSILLKPGKLTQEEFAYMKSHTVRGCEILDAIEGVWENDYHKISYAVCRHHHERYDGRGYPDGLKGDEIPIAAQIVSVADVYDALVCERCYKDAIPKDRAFHMILNGECGVFSPKILECFRAVRKDFERMADTMKK